MKIVFAAVLVALVAVAPALAKEPPGGTASPAFGALGTPAFTPYPLPENLRNAHNAGEPTIGIPWDTDHVFFQAFSATHRAVFEDPPGGAGPAAVTWTDVSPAFTPINVDPMLHADPVTGRIWAGGLDGPCSVMGISDDDGATWVPSGNMCSGPQLDHQSIGSGPWSATAPDTPLRNGAYPRATYYCAQLAVTACATSLDGGRAWQPFTEVTGPCGGLHGHIQVSEATGFAAVPHGGCAGPEALAPDVTETGPAFVGFAYTSDNGATWRSRVMPDAVDGEGFDPALAFSRQSGWMWLAQADSEGVHVALSKDEGASWETLGQATPGAAPAAWLDLRGTFHDPRTGDPLVFGSFPDLVAGDDGRVALAFMATTNPDGQEPFSPPSTGAVIFAPSTCSDVSDGNVWHYYVSQSFDAGQSWTTTRLWEDPVQVGAIWNGGGAEDCRNLNDFNDMDMDSEGRLHIGFADGCTKDCARAYAAWANGTGEAPKGRDSRDSWGTVLRQSTGRGLLAAHDLPETASSASTGPASGGKGSPGLGFAALAIAVVAAAAIASRRR
jgi:hypothetical protein